MVVYRDSNAPAGRVVFGGTEFVDGVTDNISPGPETLRLFAAAGIVKVRSEPSVPVNGTDTPRVNTPAPKPRKK